MPENLHVASVWAFGEYEFSEEGYRTCGDGVKLPCKCWVSNNVCVIKYQVYSPSNVRGVYS